MDTMKMKRLKPKVYVWKKFTFIIWLLGIFLCALLYLGLKKMDFLQEPQSAPSAQKDDAESVNKLRRFHIERQHVRTC